MPLLSRFTSNCLIFSIVACLGLVEFFVVENINRGSISFTIYGLTNHSTTNSTNFSNFDRSDRTSKPPLVLVWAHKNNKGFRDLISPIFTGCPNDLNCTITFDRNRYNQSAAIVFHIRDLEWNDLPPVRYPHQYYVFGLLESPKHTYRDFSPSNRRSFFNLTMTYRTDSDAYWSTCGYFRPSLRSMFHADWETMRKIVEGKSKLVAWFVSNCGSPSGRDQFAKKLQEYVPVDVYGNCGPLKCQVGDWNNGLGKPGLHDAGPCNQILTKEYKFYLSLENSICKGYVTEKLYFNMDNSLVIPVVFERKIVLDSIMDEELARLMNGSFIAVDDFETVHDLAKYLKYLDGNVTAYMEYFEWRKNSEVGYTQQCCQLCKILREAKRRTIDDISEWWYGQGKCHSWNES